MLAHPKLPPPTAPCTPQLLSNFCDNLLKKSGERLSDDALEDKLEKVVRLFCYLSDKDIFAEFYKKQLAKRLLLARSSSDDAERAMIAKLKLRCGAQFTSKLEGMVTDMNLSSDMQVSDAPHISPHLPTSPHISPHLI